MFAHIPILCVTNDKQPFIVEVKVLGIGTILSKRPVCRMEQCQWSQTYGNQTSTREVTLTTTLCSTDLLRGLIKPASLYFLTTSIASSLINQEIRMSQFIQLWGPGRIKPRFETVENLYLPAIPHLATTRMSLENEVKESPLNASIPPEFLPALFVTWVKEKLCIIVVEILVAFQKTSSPFQIVNEPSLAPSDLQRSVDLVPFPNAFSPMDLVPGLHSS